MHPQTRRAIFYCFLAAFLVAAPLVVLYTAGYRYNFRNGQIIQTGLLSIHSVPRGLNVVIDGRTYHEKTPAVIDNLYPGDHTIGLEKDGLLPWRKTLPVLSHTTTFIIDAAVYPDTAPTNLVAGQVAGLFPSHAGNSFVYLTVQEGWREVWLYRTLDASPQLLARLPAITGQVIAPAWSANDGYVVLTVRQPKSQTATVYDAATLATFEIARLALGDEVEWDVAHGDTLFVRRGNKILTRRLPQIAETALPMADAAVRTDGDGYLAAQSVDDGVVLARWQGETSTILAYLPLGDYRFHPCPLPNIVLLEDKKRERLLLIDTQDPEQPVLLNAMAAIWRWEPDGERLLYSDLFDLHVFDPTSLSDLTLTRLSRPLADLAWHPVANSIFYLQADNLTAVDLDSRNGHIMTVLAAGNNFTHLSVDARGKTAYFSGTVGEESGLFVRLLQK